MTLDGEPPEKSYRSKKVMKLYSWWPFQLKSSIQEKLELNFLTFEIHILEMTLDGKMIKTKVVNLKSYKTL